MSNLTCWNVWTLFSGQSLEKYKNWDNNSKIILDTLSGHILRIFLNTDVDNLL